MIPMLYKTRSNIIGGLSEAVRCEVTEERNGTFELLLEYPVNGALISQIDTGNIIKAKPNPKAEPQSFRIYKFQKSLNNTVIYYAEHISYELSGYPIVNVHCENKTAKEAIEAVIAASEVDIKRRYSVETYGFSGKNSIELSLVSVRAALGGVEGSILDTFGGEYEFDDYTIKLHKMRGEDRDVKIIYGKNLIDMKQEKNISETYTHLLPYARYTPQSENSSQSELQEEIITLSEKMIESETAENFRTRVLIKDFTEYFEENEEINEANLRTKAEDYIKNNDFGIPEINITVSFINLWESPEYKKLFSSEYVGLCDIVTVILPKLDIDVKAKIIKTCYDVLKNRYISLDLGSMRGNLADTINQVMQTAADAKHIALEASKSVQKISKKEDK